MGILTDEEKENFIAITDTESLEKDTMTQENFTQSFAGDATKEFNNKVDDIAIKELNAEFAVGDYANNVIACEGVTHYQNATEWLMKVTPEMQFIRNKPENGDIHRSLTFIYNEKYSEEILQAVEDIMYKAGLEIQQLIKDIK